MKIISLEINCLRGIKYLKLDLAGKNSIIYGDNGTGKSGVIDAIDFLIKGNITRLSGDGCGNLQLDKHGKYVTEDINNAWVKADVKLPNYPETIRIERKLKKPRELLCDKKYQSDFEKISELSVLQAHYLSRREILQFINSTDQERAKRIEKILNINSLGANRNNLLKIKKSFADNLKGKQDQEETYINQISKKLGVEYKYWLDAINQIRLKLGANEITELQEDAIIADISLSKQSILQTQVSSLLQRIDDVCKSLYGGADNLISQIRETKLVNEKMLLSKEYEQYISSIVLYEQGKKLLKTNECPLCGQEIENLEKFSIKLQEKINNLNETKKVYNEYKTKSRKLQQTLDNIKNQLKSLDFDQLSKYIDCQKLNNFSDDILFFANSLENDNFPLKIAENFLKRSYDIVVTACFDELSKVSAKMALDSKENDYKTLIDVNSNYRLLLQIQKDISISSRQAERARIICDAYESAQTHVLNEMYESIQDRFSQLYKIIHETDESAFSSAFNRKAASLELQVKFKDGEMYPPNAVHSEGHQDSMGICLFFALSEKISNNQLNLILLDDVVMSIDIDHRKNFCKLLKEQFPQKQFIITTHDYIWRKELESQKVVEKSNIIHFKAWDLSHGPYVEIGINVWDAINTHLANGHKNEAIGLMRYYMEEFFSDICAKYKLLVPYSTTGNWSVEQVLSPVRVFYSNAIKKAKESAQSYKKPIDRIEQFENQFKRVYNCLQIERWTINPSTHFTTWAQSLSIEELKRTCLAVKEFCELFECPNCHSLITITTDCNLEPQNIFCSCGDFSFSCIRRKNK